MTNQSDAERLAKPMQGLAAYLRCEARTLGLLSHSHKVLMDWASEVEQAARNSGAGLAIPEGWKLVPTEPTPEMLSKVMRDYGGIGGGSCGEHVGVDWDDMRGVYEAMLSAAPDAPQPVESSKHFAPDGYFEKLGAAIKATPRLPAQSTEFDPPIEPLAQPASQAVMQRPALPVNWAGMIHYPDCWDTAAYPTLHDAIHECLAWSGCSVCKPVQPAEPLSEDEVLKAIQSCGATVRGQVYLTFDRGSYEVTEPTGVAMMFARAIEAAHNIKPKASHDQ